MNNGLGAEAKVCVAVRVRPLIEREKDADGINWAVDGSYIQQVDPKTQARINTAYTFDHVFSMKQRTKEVYDRVVAPVVEQAFSGFNGTVLCYGQTSSGKTYTLFGNDNEDGILSLTSQHLFNRISQDQSKTYIIRIGLVEIYNEKITDLLAENTEKQQEIQLMEVNNVVVPKGLEEIEILKPEDMLAAMQNVQGKRKVGETLMNKESSRSHSILRIVISCVPKFDEDDDENGKVTNALLNFVDLAGSEKVSQSGAVGERFKEATSINKSLSTLSQVIMQLSEDETLGTPSVKNLSTSIINNRSQLSLRKAAKFVNYRDSKLTRILQSSLSGNAYIVMICNITPASIDETISTLRFARTAKKIQTKPLPNTLNRLQFEGNELGLTPPTALRIQRRWLRAGFEEANKEIVEGKIFHATEIAILKEQIKSLEEKLAKSEARREEAEAILESIGSQDIIEKLTMIQNSLQIELIDASTLTDPVLESISQAHQQTQTLQVELVDASTLTKSLQISLTNQQTQTPQLELVDASTLTKSLQLPVANQETQTSQVKLFDASTLTDSFQLSLKNQEAQTPKVELVNVSTSTIPVSESISPANEEVHTPNVELVDASTSTLPVSESVSLSHQQTQTSQVELKDASTNPLQICRVNQQAQTKKHELVDASTTTAPVSDSVSNQETQTKKVKLVDTSTSPNSLQRSSANRHVQTQTDENEFVGASISATAVVPEPISLPNEDAQTSQVKHVDASTLTKSSQISRVNRQAQTDKETGYDTMVQEYKNIRIRCQTYEKKMQFAEKEHKRNLDKEKQIQRDLLSQVEQSKEEKTKLLERIEVLKKLKIEDESQQSQSEAVPHTSTTSFSTSSSYTATSTFPRPPISPEFQPRPSKQPRLMDPQPTLPQIKPEPKETKNLLQVLEDMKKSRKQYIPPRSPPELRPRACKQPRMEVQPKQDSKDLLKLLEDIKKSKATRQYPTPTLTKKSDKKSGS